MLEALENLLASRAEARRSLAGRIVPCGDVRDALRADEVPSVWTRGAADRVLAEIDHDGFAFAVAAEDAPLFPGRATRLPRLGNLLDVVLDSGRVCVRKRFRAPSLRAVLAGKLRVSAREWALRNVWQLAAVHFYGEVAALLRLGDLPFVPRLRRVDVRRRTLWIDYLAGTTLRHEAARAGVPVHDADLPDEVRGVDAGTLEVREARLLEGIAGSSWHAEVLAMAREIKARGVVPLDVKLGNFLRGARSGALYWIDFERSRLACQPGFETAVALQDDLLSDLLGGSVAEPQGRGRKSSRK